MKFNYLYKAAAGLALTALMASCSSDYLDLEPQVSLPYEEVLPNVEGATLAVHGLCGSMYQQYQALYDYNWFNGEPWLMMFYGEVLGQDYISYFWQLTGLTSINWQGFYQNGSLGSLVGWSYCYGLISQANNIISFAPKLLDEEGNPVKFGTSDNTVPDIEGEYAFRYAQALTMRAHAYTRLMQIYAPRWEDRFYPDKTEKLTVCLRLDFVEPEGDLNCELAKMSTVMDQIYTDLDQAIEMYKSCGLHRTYDWEPDIQIAQGIYARAALIKNDYKTAQQMAHDARQGYEIMSADDYLAGFATPTSEWMWTNSGQSQGIYYASFGASYACNGAYPCLWGTIGAGAIDIDLLSLAERRDTRTSIFFTPSNVLDTSLKSEFWNSSSCDPQSLNINSTSNENKLHKTFVNFAQTQYVKMSENGWFPPYTYMGSPMGEGSDQTSVLAQFGAQFKFWGMDGYSTSFFPFMRASELLLTEAEAAWWNDDPSTALALLNELNAKRINRYSNVNYSGAELLEKIKVCRRLELWGEGFNWFDFKRWGEPIVRRAWVENDDTSGNWPSAISTQNAPGGEFAPDEYRHWAFKVPFVELQYNKAIDQATADSNDY